MGTVVLELTAGGVISDYSDVGLQFSIAKAAKVDKSLVTIAIAAASVKITATIAVPPSTTVAAVEASLNAALGTIALASTALGITVVAVPAVVVQASPSPPSPPPDDTYDDYSYNDPGTLECKAKCRESGQETEIGCQIKCSLYG